MRPAPKRRRKESRRRSPSHFSPAIHNPGTLLRLPRRPGRRAGAHQLPALMRPSCSTSAACRCALSRRRRDVAKLCSRMASEVQRAVLSLRLDCSLEGELEGSEALRRWDRPHRGRHPAAAPGRGTSGDLERERPDLLQQGQHVEVVVDVPHLPAVKPGPQRRLDLDLRSGWLEGSAWRLQRARVRALPQDLLRDGVAAGDRSADRAAEIGERILPALNQCDVGVGAFDAPSRSVSA